jgi:hypothetical protein
MTGTDRRGAVVVLAGIAGAALVLRVIGLQFGLPAVYNPDEVAILARALSFAKGTLNPHNFLYPTFYFYVLFAWVGVYLAWVRLSGRVSSIAALQQLYFSSPTGIYTAGRLLGAISGTATVVLVHLFGSRLADARTGIAAAVFIAAAPLAVRDAHYIKHDVFATMTIVMAYLAMTRVWPAPRPGGPTLREAVVAGAGCGVAFSTHYYCVFLAVPLAWAVYQAWRPSGGSAVIRGLAAAGTASAVMFLMLSPFLLVESSTAWRDIVANRQIVIDRAVAGGAFGPAGRYLQLLWEDSIGVPILLLAAAGAIGMSIAHPARAVFVLAFPVPFFAFITNTYPASRYLNPILPFIAVLAGWTLSSAAARVRARSGLFGCAVFLSVAPALVSSVRSDLFFRQTDTRSLALRYIEQHIPAGSTVLVQPYSVPMNPSRESLVEALTRNLGSVEAASTKFQLQLAQRPYPEPAYRLIYLGHGGLDAEKLYVDYAQLGGQQGLEPLRRLGVAFVVVKRYNGPDPETEPFLAALSREGRQVAAFSPYRAGLSGADQARIDPFLHNTDARIDEALERPGPQVEIWRIDR